jgi:hypothetical protein
MKAIAIALITVFLCSLTLGIDFYVTGTPPEEDLGLVHNFHVSGHYDWIHTITDANSYPGNQMIVSVEPNEIFTVVDQNTVSSEPDMVVEVRIVGDVPNGKTVMEMSAVNGMKEKTVWQNNVFSSDRTYPTPGGCRQGG